MNILLHFISVIESDFAKADIKEYIADIRQGEGFYSSDTVEYTEDNGLYLKNASLEVIIALLWAVWVYIKVYVYLHPNNAMANSIKLIFNIMRENYPYSEGELKKHPLIAHASVAMTLMCQHIQAKAKKSKPSKSMAEKPVKDNTEKLLTRIKELEEEVEKLRKDIEDYQTQGKGVSASKHALLLTTLCHHLGGLPQNGRQSLSPILQKLYGYTETTATRALNQKITQKDADALAKSFSELSPRVGNAIKEMPGILEKLNNERLRKLNEQKK